MGERKREKNREEKKEAGQYNLHHDSVNKSVNYGYSIILAIKSQYF